MSSLSPEENFKEILSQIVPREEILDGVVYRAAGQRSISMRKLVHGVGINNSHFTVHPIVNGKRIRHPIYMDWVNMLMRAYFPNFHVKHPSYLGTTVCKEWHSFMNFYRWAIQQEWQGNELDKDIILINCKLYSPETCVYVTQAVNSLLNDHGAVVGEWPTGVTWQERDRKFNVRLCVGEGTRQALGYYDSAEQAGHIYLINKAPYVAIIAHEQSDPRVYNGLMRHAYHLMPTLTPEMWKTKNNPAQFALGQG